MDSPVLFSSARVERLRRRAQKACPPGPPRPDGWSRCDVDFSPLLAAFPTLTLRDGLVLGAYLYVSGASCSSVIWAVPHGEAIPEPAECMTGQPERPYPRPACAVPAPEGLTGDGSPWSYVCASILTREIGEWGAAHHGRWWSTHVVLGADPWAAAHSPRPSRSAAAPFPGRPGGRPEDWRWSDPRPAEWRPAFRLEAGMPVVVFHTYSPLGRESIYRHLDTYAPGTYISSSSIKSIAEGGPGLAF